MIRRTLIFVLLAVFAIAATAQTSFLVPANNAQSTLNGAITSGATSATVQTGGGANFPSAFPYHVLVDLEIVRVTNRSGDVLTIARAQEGTLASSHNGGATVSLVVSAEYISQIQAAVNTLETAVGGGDVEDLSTSGGSGTAPVSNGAGALTMVDIATQLELDAISVATLDDVGDVTAPSPSALNLLVRNAGNTAWESVSELESLLIDAETSPSILRLGNVTDTGAGHIRALGGSLSIGTDGDDDGNYNWSIGFPETAGTFSIAYGDDGGAGAYNVMDALTNGKNTLRGEYWQFSSINDELIFYLASEPDTGQQNMAYFTNEIDFFGIGNTFPTHKLDVSGTFRATGIATLDAAVNAGGLLTAGAGITSTTAANSFGASTFTGTSTYTAAEIHMPRNYGIRSGSYGLNAEAFDGRYYNVVNAVNNVSDSGFTYRSLSAWGGETFGWKISGQLAEIIGETDGADPVTWTTYWSIDNGSGDVVAEGDYDIKGGDLELGVADSVAAILDAHGDSTNTGGRLRLRNGGSKDTTNEYLSIYPNQETLEFQDGDGHVGFQLVDTGTVADAYVTGILVHDDDFGADEFDGLRQFTANVTTTDASATNLITFTSDDDELWYIDCNIAALRNGSTQGAGYSWSGTYRNDSGTLTEVGEQIYAQDEDNAAWDVSGLPFGEAIIVQVTGVIATTIKWNAHCDCSVVDY